MFRCVNARTLATTVFPIVLALACRPADRGTDGPRSDAVSPADTASVGARVDAGPADAVDGPAARRDTAREESARFLPEPYGNLWIGETLSRVLEDYPEAKPYVSRGDPERLDWQELQGPAGLIVRLGFLPGPESTVQELRSIQFMSLLPAPVAPSAPASPLTLTAWRQWFNQAYEPHLAALRDKYGEKADVYSCGGGAQHPIVRIVWRGDALAVTSAFLLHDKGLSSTLIITPLEVAERYIRATQCRWVQDRVL